MRGTGSIPKCAEYVARLTQEVWLYLLGVLSADKSQEMTTVRNKFLEYESVSKRIPFVEKQVRTEVLRYYRQRLSSTSSERERFGISIIRGPRPAPTTSNTFDAEQAQDVQRDEPKYPRILPSTQYGLLTMRSNPMVDDSEAVYDQRRLSQNVENVLCAYLNRHLLNPAQEGEHPQAERDEEYAALQKTMESRMPRAYQWAPQASLVPGTNLGDFHPSLVYLCAPFAQCVRAEAGIYFAFERLMTMIEEYNAIHPLPQRVASFLTLFRTTLPELHAYFEAEEVDLLAVATSWLQHLLAREMQMDDLMRLWGTSPCSPRHLLCDARPARPAPLRLPRDPDQLQGRARRPRPLRDDQHALLAPAVGRRPRTSPHSPRLSATR